MEDVISRKEHEEFAKRMEMEDTRQNRRIELLEENLKEVSRQTTAIEKLANSMDAMQKEQEKQGSRLEALEGRDGEMWRKAVGYALTAIISIAIGYVFAQIGIG